MTWAVSSFGYIRLLSTVYNLGSLLTKLFLTFSNQPFLHVHQRTLHIVHCTLYWLNFASAIHWVHSFPLIHVFSHSEPIISESNPSHWHWLSAIIVRVLLNWRYCAVLSVDPCFIELSVSNPWLQAAIEPICLLHTTSLWPPSKTF